MGTLITSLNEDSARDLFFDFFFLLNIISKIYQSAYHDGQLTQQAVPSVHSVTILEPTIVDNTCMRAGFGVTCTHWNADFICEDSFQTSEKMICLSNYLVPFSLKFVELGSTTVYVL